MKTALNSTTVPAQGQKSLSVLLDEIEERADRATEGPWEHCKGGSVFSPAHRISSGVAVLLYVESEHLNADANFDFIAAARTDVPRLVKALRYALKNWGHGVEADVAALLNGEVDLGK